MKNTLKFGLLLLGAAVFGMPANVFALFSYDASYNCADCHGDGRTWDSVHGGGGGGGGGTPAPAVLPAVNFNGVVGDQTSVDPAEFYAGNGFIAVAKKTDGTFTGTVRLQGKALPIKGKFDPTGNATDSVAGNAIATTALTVGKIKTPVNVALSFDPTVLPGEISGSVTVGNGTQLDFTALPNYTGGNQPPANYKHELCGKYYTIILPSPDETLGHGYATLSVAANGAAKFAGKLSDGTIFTSTSYTVDDGNGNWVVPVQIPLYKGLGVVVGEIKIPKVVPTNSAGVIGALGWMSPGAPKAKAIVSRTAFVQTLEPTGEIYPKLVKGTSLIPGGTFTLLAGSLQPLAGKWPATNVPSFLPSKLAKMTLTPATGIIKGSFCPPGGKSTSFEGVILAKPVTAGADTLQGAGFFSTGTGFGSVEITVP